MMKPPQNLTAVYNSGAIVVTWQVAPTSDTPTEIVVTLNNKITGVQQSLPGNNAGITFQSSTVSQFAGTLVSVYVTFISSTAHDSATAPTSVTVPANGAAPPSQPQIPGHYKVPPPINLSVMPNPATHSVNFEWQNQGPYSGSAYDKVIVLWGRTSDPLPYHAQFDLSGNAQQATLGPIYPNTAYTFQVEGGVTAGLAGYTYSGWSSLPWVSPAGSVPDVGWFRNWFSIHPEAPLEPSNPRLLPGKSVTALWRDGTSDLHLDLFLAGGIPTLGETWSAWWQPNAAWQPWFNPGNAVWAQNVSVMPGAKVTALWRPGSKHLDLFATATNGDVWSTWWENDPGWQEWFLVHPQTRLQRGAPVTAVWRPNSNHLDLFATGASGPIGMVWSTWWEPDKGWQPWFTVSNAVWAPNVSVKPGAEVAALWTAGGNHLDLFATANDGSAWSTWWDTNNGWQNWFAIDPATRLAPGAPITALWSSAETLELFATSGDGTVLGTHWDAAHAWRAWSAVMGNSVKLQPAAAVTVVRGPQLGYTLQAFGTAADGVVWNNSRPGIYPEAQWQSWIPVHPETAMLPGATVAALLRPSDYDSNHLDLFARASDGSVWSIWWESGYYD